MIMIVFGHPNDQIRDENIVAFNTINTAYSFQPESLVLVINGLPSYWKKYVWRHDTCFTSTFIGKSSYFEFKYLFFRSREYRWCHRNGKPEEKSSQSQLDICSIILINRSQILAVKKSTAKLHKKNQEIETRLDHLKHTRKEGGDNQIRFEDKWKKYLKQRAAKQNKI